MVFFYAGRIGAMDYSVCDHLTDQYLKREFHLRGLWCRSKNCSLECPLRKKEIYQEYIKAHLRAPRGEATDYDKMFQMAMPFLEAVSSDEKVA